MDTQPVARRPHVRLGGRAVGALGEDEWLETVAAVDAQVERAIDAGLFELRQEERFALVHAFDSGPECLEEVGTWVGTRVPSAVADALCGTPEPATVEQEIRLRLLRRPEDPR